MVSRLTRAWQILLSGPSRVKINFDVIITVKVNGYEVVGPITGQNLAIIAKYGDYNGNQDILQSAGIDAYGNRIEMFIEYTKGK